MSDTLADTLGQALDLMEVTDADEGKFAADQDQRDRRQHLKVTEPRRWLSETVEFKDAYDTEWAKWDRTIG